MSISSTSLTNPQYLGRIKAAVVRAVRKANEPHAVNGLGHAEVYNRREKPSLSIVARKGGGFEVFDDEDNDVTDMVKAALAKHHQEKGENE